MSKKTYIFLFFVTLMLGNGFKGPLKARLCKKYGSKGKLTLLFVIPFPTKCYCNLAIPSVQWKKLTEIFKDKEEVRTILLISPEFKRDYENLAKGIRKIRVYAEQPLTLICKERFPIYKIEGNFDIIKFRRILEITKNTNSGKGVSLPKD